ncbi:hypothetical protein AB1N83_010004, partial [Pleurotus pulmonarius]
ISTPRSCSSQRPRRKRARSRGMCTIWRGRAHKQYRILLPGLVPRLHASSPREITARTPSLSSSPSRGASSRAFHARCHPFVLAGHPKQTR